MLAEYVDVYSPLLYTPNPPQVVSIATPAQAKMKLWKETSRSSKTTTSSRCGLAATPSRLPVKAALSTFLFRTLIYCKNYMDVSDVWCNQLLFPFNTILSTVWWCPCYVTAVYVNNWSWHVHGSHSVCLQKTGCDNSPACWHFDQTPWSKNFCSFARGIGCLFPLFIRGLPFGLFFLFSAFTFFCTISACHIELHLYNCKNVILLLVVCSLCTW
jgi:hypothetical protein